MSMKRGISTIGSGVTAGLLALAAFGVQSALAIPTLTSLGTGSPISVTNSQAGTIYIGGGGIRWQLTGSSLTTTTNSGSGGGVLSADGMFMTGYLPNVGPTVVGNTAAGVTPAHNPNPTLVPAVNQPATTEFAVRRWNVASDTWSALGGLPIVPSLICYGSGSSGSSSGNFLSGHGISATGQFIVGQAYVCTYNNAGTAVSANTFRWRPFIWDANANAGAGEVIVLPTPLKTTAGQTALRRTGNAYKVSSDGTVVAGATEHNVGTTPNADADGGRLVVWRKNGLGVYEMTYLDTGVDGSGFPKYVSTTPSAVDMNDAGTIIVARGPDGITKWTWNGTSWGAPNVIGNNLSTPASWLPAAVTGCGIPPNIGGQIAMSEDGNTIVGSATYSTCGSFMTQGFIWHASDNLIQDWYDYNAELGTPGCSVGGDFGPIGDLGDPTKGQPALGNPYDISPDGTIIVGRQFGNQVIVGAMPWIWQETGGPACVAPTITGNPAATTNFSVCTSSIILNASASGTPPLAYQWYKNGNPLADGPSGSGSNITGATSFQFRITPDAGFTLSTGEAGNYTCVVTGSCGTPVTTTTAVVQVDSAFPPAANDTCSTATVVSAGTNVLSPAQSPCGAYVNDMPAFGGCALAATKADLWYSFTPSVTGEYRIETCGSNYDTVIGLFEGCGGNELGCNDNVDANTGPTCGSTNRSRINSVTLNAGTEYKICLSAGATAFLSSSSSAANLSINLAPVAPANDSCSAATAVEAGVYAFNTSEATADGVAALACSASANLSRDLWYSYTAAGPGRLNASTCPTGTATAPYSLMTNTVLSLYDGPCGNVLSCNDNHSPVPSGCGSQLSTISNYAMATGSTVWIRVSGTNATTHGQGQLSLSFQCAADLDSDGVFPGGTPDGGVDINDLLFFLSAFESGNVAADLDNGTGTGTTDGGVDINDLLFFLVRFELGC